VSGTNPPKTNFDRLLEHLPQGGLAAQLVAAHVNRGSKTSAAAMREVLQQRLAVLKSAHAEPADQ
jgi:hypothetical protein